MTTTELIDCLNNNLGIQFTKILATEAVNSPTLIAQLVALAKSNQYPTDWRAAWVLDHINQTDKGLIDPYLQSFVDTLWDVKSDGVKRHYLKMISQGNEDILNDGRLVDLCFSWLMSQQTPIASRAHCMEILRRLTKIYPELANELVPILNEIITNGSKGEKNKAAKVLSQINPSH